MFIIQMCQSCSNLHLAAFRLNLLIRWKRRFSYSFERVQSVLAAAIWAAAAAPPKNVADCSEKSWNQLSFRRNAALSLRQPVTLRGWVPAIDCHPWIGGGTEYATWCHTVGPVMLLEWQSHHRTTLWCFARAPDLVWIICLFLFIWSAPLTIFHYIRWEVTLNAHNTLVFIASK